MKKIGYTFPLWAILFYTLCWTVMTWPLVTVFDSAFITDGGDGPMFIWNIDHFVRTLRSGANPFFTDEILHPVGTPLFMHTYTILYGLTGLFHDNPVLVLNCWVFLSFILSGLGAFLLCFNLTGDRWFALLSGFVFAFCPYKLAHLMEHYNLVQTATIPFFVLLTMQSLRFEAGRILPRVTSRLGVLCAASLLGITLLSSFYYTWYLISFILILTGWHLFRCKRIRFLPRKWSITLALSALGSTLMVIALNAMGVPSRGRGAGADLLALITPSARSRFLSTPLFEKLHTHSFLQLPIENTVSIGISLLLPLCALALVRRTGPDQPGQARLGKQLLFFIAVYLLLAMPQVYVGGRILCALPSVIWHYIPFFNNIHVACRYLLLVMLFLPIFLALLARERIYSRIPSSLRPVLPAALLCAAFFEYSQRPYPVLSFRDIPTAHRHLAAKEEGTLLEVPSGICSGLREIGIDDRRQMFYQTVHRKKIIGGSVSRIGETTFSAFTEAPVLSDLFAMLQDSLYRPPPPAPGAAEEFLFRFNLRYLMIYPRYRGSPAERYIISALLPYAHTDTTIAGYRLVSLKAGGEAAVKP